MIFKRKKDFIDYERERVGSLSESEIEEALTTIAIDPVRTYLVHMVDEVVRQGIYLDEKEREGAKFFVKVIGDELQKANDLLKRKNRK